MYIYVYFVKMRQGIKLLMLILYVCCFITDQVWINLGDIILLGLRDYQVQYP